MITSNAVLEYIAEEVYRQGDDARYVPPMLYAWNNAIANRERPLSLNMIRRWGELVTPLNSHGWRGVNVYVGAYNAPRVDDLPRLLARWIENVPNMTPEQAYKTFEEIHPFRDGNGRVGKIIYNFLRGTLLAPQWPPNFWGGSNP